MTSNSTIGRSKWIAAAVAMIFMVSAAAVCLDAAYAAGDDEPETFDVDETFTSIFGIISFLFIEEPSDDATVISNDHDVNHSEEYDDLVLKDGAVLNFNNGAVLSADRLFIEGNVKFVNADGSKPRLFAESVFLEGCRCLLTDTALTTDKSVTVDAKKTTTGFYDPSSGTLDTSKGMKESLDAKIYIDGYMELSGKTQAKFYSGNGSPAVEFYADYDLDGFYKSLKDNLDGMVMDASSVSKVVDYLANKLVYPDIDLGMKVAKATAGSATVSDVSVTFVSSQADGDIAFGLNVGSSEGDFECEKLVLNAVRSLEKTDISGSADRLVSKSAGSNIGAAKQTAEFRNLKFSFSTEEDKVLEIVAANIADGPQAVIDA
ncbi:MAG: hypothetical protein J5674_01380, partial [Candidatus Methanomethylophilaceae archaeon]|nr:hypothetical protein [Candidatus Methanomethylophilaceae archaeon]